MNVDLVNNGLNILNDYFNHYKQLKERKEKKWFFAVLAFQLFKEYDLCDEFSILHYTSLLKEHFTELFYQNLNCEPRSVKALYYHIQKNVIDFEKNTGDESILLQYALNSYNMITNNTALRTHLFKSICDIIIDETKVENITVKTKKLLSEMFLELRFNFDKEDIHMFSETYRLLYGLSPMQNQRDSNKNDGAVVQTGGGRPGCSKCVGGQQQTTTDDNNQQPWKTTANNQQPETSTTIQQTDGRSGGDTSVVEEENLFNIINKSVTYNKKFSITTITVRISFKNIPRMANDIGEYLHKVFKNLLLMITKDMEPQFKMGVTITLPEFENAKSIGLSFRPVKDYPEKTIIELLNFVA